MSASKLLDTVIAIAAAAPKKQGQHVYSAQVPWALIHQLRERLDAMGIEWRQR